MALEIERKFLVVGEEWKQSKGVHICQGYLNRDKNRIVRIRTAGDQGFLTIKELTILAARGEFEYGIPLDDARHLLGLCRGAILEKVRYTVPYAGLTWEVDEFLGANAGLIIAEVELASKHQEIELPPWVGREVTQEACYYNSNLVVRPYSTWKKRRAGSNLQHYGLAFKK